MKASRKQWNMLPQDLQGYDDFPRLLSAIRGLQNLQQVRIHVPRGFIPNIRCAFTKADTPPFPFVTSLCIDIATVYILKHCPKIDSLILRAQAPALYDSDQEEWEAKYHKQYQSQLLNLEKVQGAARYVRDSITHLGFLAHHDGCYPWMLEGWS